MATKNPDDGGLSTALHDLDGLCTLDERNRRLFESRIAQLEVDLQNVQTELERSEQEKYFLHAQVAELRQQLKTTTLPDDKDEAAPSGESLSEQLHRRKVEHDTMVVMASELSVQLAESLAINDDLRGQLVVASRRRHSCPCHQSRGSSLPFFRKSVQTSKRGSTVPEEIDATLASEVSFVSLSNENGENTRAAEQLIV